MFGEEKNLKDSQNNSQKDTHFVPTLYGQTGSFHLGSYTKTHKLITALYMVTDIIDKDEPLRNKLRTLGAGIISDMHLVQQNNTGYTMSFIFNKVSEIISFLDIASAVNIISEMNCNILRKEFFELNEAIKGSIDKDDTAHRQKVDLSEFFSEELTAPQSFSSQTTSKTSVIKQAPVRSNYSSMRHHNPTRIGVQKGSTLLEALHEKMSKRNGMSDAVNSFDELKKDRHSSIVNIIKNIPGGATIKDIKDKISAMPREGNSLVSFSEKTLQRELISMVKNGVLNKTGEKRWSRYFLKN